MSANTKIEWADHTFNPWEGCQKISPGCDHCYAEARDARFAGGTAVHWGPGAPRRRTSPANWRKPLQWNSQADHFFKCADCPMRWHAHSEAGRVCPACGSRNYLNARQRVFCASLADVFDNEVDPQWRVDLWALMEATPNLDWLVLTKRIGIVRPWIALYGTPANMWLGITVVNQTEANRDIPKLMGIPAAKRFVSLEPLLGPIDLQSIQLDQRVLKDAIKNPAHYKLDWVIAGGESGPNARPAHPDWFRSLRDQCQANGVAFLFKQWGEWVDFEQMSTAWWNSRTYAQRIALERVYLDGLLMNRIGKKAAGRQLDGVEHDGFPA